MEALSVSNVRASSVENDSAKPKIACVTNTSFSGSTIFCLLANTHPQVAALGDGLNPRVLKTRGDSFVCSCGELLNDCPFWSAVFSAVRQQGVPFSIEDCNLRYSYLHPLLDRVLGRYHDDPVRRVFRQAALAAWPKHRRHVELHNRRNVAFCRAVLEASGKSVYLHNTKPLLMLYHLRDNPELDVSVITMVRDARGFVNSAMKRGTSALDAATRWRNYHQRVADLTRGIDSSRLLTLKYEDLCGDTESCMKRVFRFLDVEDVPVSRTVVPSDHHIAGNDLRLKKELTVRLDEDWQSKLSERDVAVIERQCRPTCEALGYEW